MVKESTKPMTRCIYSAMVRYMGSLKYWAGTGHHRLRWTFRKNATPLRFAMHHHSLLRGEISVNPYFLRHVPTGRDQHRTTTLSRSRQSMQIVVRLSPQSHMVNYQTIRPAWTIHTCTCLTALTWQPAFSLNKSNETCSGIYLATWTQAQPLIIL